MGMGKEERQVRDLLAAHGTFIRHTRHGVLWELPGGDTFQCLADESRAGGTEWRAWKNSLKELQRKLRTLGLLEDDPQQDDEDGPEAEEEDMPDLQALGIHVNRSTKKIVTVVETETAEALVTVSALGQLLGLADMGDEVEIQVLTCNDDVVGDKHSTFKFKVVRETIKEEEEAA